MLLNTVVLIFLLCGGLQAAELLEATGVETREDWTDSIRQILDCIRPKLTDPVEQDELNLDDLGGGFVHLNSIILKGISGLNASYVGYDTSVCTGGICLEVTAELSIPSLSLTTGYNADVTLFDTLRIYGDGNISLTLDDFAPKLLVTLAIGTAEISINDFSVNLEVGGVDFQATGLLNDEYMSQLISNMIKDIIKDHLSEIFNKVVEYLTDAIQNGDGEGSDEIINQLVAILEELLTDCLNVDIKSVNIGALLRRR